MATLTVGSGQYYTTIAAAVAAAQDGDTVQVQAGTYVNDFAHVATRITLQAVGGLVSLVATVSPPNGKAILDTYADTVVDGFSFSGAAVPDNNGAGIRSNAGDLTVRNSVFANNQEGILATSGPDTTVTITGSEFGYNGAGDGYSHNLYVGAIKALVIDNSYFHDANVGHEVKSRALSTTITNSRIIDGPASTASYSVDLPNGGVASIRNTVIEKGPNAQNQTIVHFGGESAPYAGSSLLMTGNTIVNDRATVTGLNNAAGSPVIFAGNTLFGVLQEQFGATSGNTVVATRPALDLSTRAVAPVVPPPAAAPTPVLADTPAGLAYVDYGRAGAVVASGHVLQVGTGRAFTTLQSALFASQDGDTVQVDAGTYNDDFATANHKVIIEGVGGMAHFTADRIPENGVGILDVHASVTVRNLTFSGARSYDGNGAGIRVRGGDVTIVNDVFTGNDVSVLANPGATSSVGIYDSEITANGNWDKATHNLNIGAVGSFTLENSYVHGGLVAHEVNDRAFFSRIEGNRIIDTDASNASFGINLGRGGVALIAGNTIEKGANAANGILVHVGGEGPTYASTNVQVIGNTLVSDVVNYYHPYTFFVVADGSTAGGVAPSVTVAGNTFVGGVNGSDQARGTISQNATVASSAAWSTALPWVAPASATEQPSVAGPDTLSLSFHTADYFAPAQVVVAVDGVAVGGGAVQNGVDLTFTGTWGGGAHAISVTEINGHYGTSIQGGFTQVLRASLNGVSVTAASNELVWQPATISIVAPYQSRSAALAASDPLANSPLFDAQYYLAHNADVAAAGFDPLQHFEQFGWAEGRDPSAAFSDSKYLSANADVRAAGIDPLLHYVQFGQAEGRSVFTVADAPSPEAALFDANYYLAHNPDVAAAGMDPLLHFQQFGWAEGRDPSATFSDSRYNQAYADVRDAHIDPLLHFAMYGQAEGRMTFAVQVPVTGPATEAQLFDASYYLGHNADVLAAHVDPLLHYEQFGWLEGRDPSAGFSTNQYLAANTDVAAASIDPLAHYAQFGQTEGRMAFPAPV